MDFDFYSVKTRIEDLTLLAPSTVTLCSRRVGKEEDPRINGLLQLTSTPMCVFARVDRRLLLSALEDNEGVLVNPGVVVIRKIWKSLEIRTEKFLRREISNVLVGFTCTGISLQIHLLLGLRLHSYSLVCFILQ